MIRPDYSRLEETLRHGVERGASLEDEQLQCRVGCSARHSHFSQAVHSTNSVCGLLRGRGAHCLAQEGSPFDRLEA
jgi:hypothetical protein